jgi:hypothetical protein
MTVAFLTGISAMYGQIREAKESMYFIGGFRRIQESLPKRFIITAALSSWVTDRVFKLILADDRLIKQLDNINIAFDTVLVWLSGLDIKIWELLSDLVDDLDPSQLRSDAIQAGHVGRSFFWFRSLRQLDELPFSLCKGDVRANLRLLALDDAPEEYIANKIWELLHRDTVFIGELVAGVELLAHASFSIRIIEQLHRHCSIVGTLHPDCMLDYITVRAFCSILDRLLPRATADERQYAAQKAKLARLIKKEPKQDWTSPTIL